jgi:uncharacterized protein with HEPN domain
MRPTERDVALLFDMLQACLEARDIVGQRSASEFVADRLRCLAVERCLEIAGEAAGRVSEQLQSQSEHIPWRRMKGMRNILAHEYGQIDHAVIFVTVTVEVPALIAALSALPGRSGP